MLLILVAGILIILVLVYCANNTYHTEHFAVERPSDVERSRNIRKRIERRQRREEEERGLMYDMDGWGGPPGPYTPGPYGRRVAPGFYEPEVNFTLMKGKVPAFFHPNDDFISKDVTKLLSNCSARFNPNCQTIVHDLDSGKAYRYSRPPGNLKNNSRINTYALI